MAKASTASAADTSASAPPKTEKVAVVYFHGMGSQRRYEEVSRLIDALDAYGGSGKEANQETPGIMMQIRPRLEVSRVDDKAETAHIRANFVEQPQEHWKPAVDCRFFEVYWAPIMAGSSSAKRILIWLFTTALRPLSTLRSPWRERQRLRRSVLLRLRRQPPLWPQSVEDADFLRLLRVYDSFERLDAQRAYPKGSFADFLGYLGDSYRNEDEAETRRRLIALAHRWQAAYKRQELVNGLLLLTLAIALSGAAILVLYGLVLLLQALGAFGVTDFLTEQGFTALGESLKPSLKNAWPILVILAGLFGLTRFLTDYLGDVEAWTTYEEVDEKYQKRKAVLLHGKQVLTHVLKDDSYDRIVIVGHSLGTAVAHDTILELARHNRARNASNPIAGPLPLEKIRHFVTLASPIDKIHYLFESYRSAYHRYRRVVEELRGDIGTVPFAKNRKPHIHWLNYWDTGDIISGPLESPANARLVDLRVDNVHSPNFWFPDPGASHAAYFRNRRVIGDLYRIIFKGAYRFDQLPVIPNKGRDYASAFRGPGETHWLPKALLLLMMTLPYLLLLKILLQVTGWSPGLERLCLAAAIAVLGFLATSYLVSRVIGQRDKL